MMIDEEPKGEELNPDTLDAVFDEETVLVEEDELIVFRGTDTDDDDVDEIDIAFAANDEGYW